MYLTCPICKRNYEYSRKKGHRKTRCNSCNATARRKLREQRCYDYKGTSCSRCGYSKCRSALCFHHKIPSQKLFTIAGSWALSWKRVKNELDKCILLCANCHAEVHEETKGS